MEKMMNGMDILAMGYGIIPKMVMRDKQLTVEAKAIYSYIASFAGTGNTAYPSVDLICDELQIGKDRFQKHKKYLLEKGYLVIQRGAATNGKFGNNLYVIRQAAANESEASENEEATEKENPLPDFTAEAGKATATRTLGNRVTNNNKSNNNNLINNKTKDLYEEDEDDTEIITKEKKTPNSFAYWQEKWTEHFGEQTPYTRMIHRGLQQWASYFGDEEVVLHGFVRAGHYGGKSYAYLDSILRNWWDEGIRSIEEIYDREIAERY